MKIIDIETKRYLVKGHEEIHNEINMEKVKKTWNADITIRKGNILYLCTKIQDAEFEDIKE